MLSLVKIVAFGNCSEEFLVFTNPNTIPKGKFTLFNVYASGYGSDEPVACELSIYNDNGLIEEHSGTVEANDFVLHTYFQ